MLSKSDQHLIPTGSLYLLIKLLCFLTAIISMKLAEFSVPRAKNLVGRDEVPVRVLSSAFLLNPPFRCQKKTVRAKAKKNNIK